MFDKDLEATLQRASLRAKQSCSEFITVEHLLLAVLDDKNVINALLACSADISDLRTSLHSFIFSKKLSLPTPGDESIKLSDVGKHVIQRARDAVQSAPSQKRAVSTVDLLVAILGERSTRAYQCLKHQGIEQLDILEYVRIGAARSKSSSISNLNGNEGSDGKTGVQILKKMTTLQMKSFDSSRQDVIVNVDEEDELNRIGGFGTVCSVEGLDGYIAKRLDLKERVAPGHAKRYLKHVNLAKKKLGDERKKAHPLTQRWIQEYLDEILNHSLSTHWCFELDANDYVIAIWFLLPRAMGKDLNEHFKDDRNYPPPIEDRIQIAYDFVMRMRTLRRPGLVHLDCTTDNIRLDKESRRLVMIDLDGCGIEKQETANHANKDDWDAFPITLGKQERVVRVPPWYPQEGIRCGPNEGNYKYAERWVALDTIIRILTWSSTGVFGWLPDDVRKELSASYGNVKRALLPHVVAEPDPLKATDMWRSTYPVELATLASIHHPLRAVKESYWTDLKQPKCLTFFSNLAQVAFFDPKHLRGEKLEGRDRNKKIYESPYDMFARHLH